MWAGCGSATRRYPGLTTQSPKQQYSLSDFPMPKSLPEWPTGAQVQEYLASYAQHFGLNDSLRLSTEVTSAEPADGGWLVNAAGNAAPERFDKLVVANGVFCEPFMQTYPGMAEFTAAGGQVIAGTELHDAGQAAGKHVLVVGYGKSACDITVPVSEVAASTDVIARHLLWKVPRKIGGVVNFKMLLLTRMGEALFKYLRPRGMEKFLHGPAKGMRANMVNSIGTASVRQFGLKRLGLVPPGQLEDIVRGAIGLATEGFFEGVSSGRIVVHGGRTIARLMASPDSGAPSALLDDGNGAACRSDHLRDRVHARVFRSCLLRSRVGCWTSAATSCSTGRVRPVEVPDLYFNGYNSSFFSPLNAEMAAVWIAADMAGAVALPSAASMRSQVAEQLAFMDVATDTHHCRGGKIIPFSLHNVDEVLGDLGVNISAGVRASHWLNPVNPTAYRKITPTVLKRLPVVQGREPAAVADEPALEESPVPH